eukprot:GHVQ01033491.1.p1 GENE.GHVQ01033491.1~~GHVQ01033491.1.p1  ORF type:complete len:100 (+),score=7.06 GHVQ01033491.1:83-382(+)
MSISCKWRLYSPFHEYDLFIRLSKLKLFRQELRVLDQVVSVEGIVPDPEKVEALISAKPPTDKASYRLLRSFVASASYLRRFVPKFSDVSTDAVNEEEC